MAHYPNTPSFTGTMRPLRLEGDIRDVEIEGEVPEQLNGTFHRVHPDAQFAPMYEDDQFFNGDGMVSLFRFQDGRIDFKQRYVQSDRWKLERAAGKALFGHYRNPLTDDPSVKGSIRSVVNTNVIVHAKKLYAMKEDGPCFVMDPLTLESEGFTDFNGRMHSETFCAHPKIDPVTGNLCAFAYATKGMFTLDMAYFEIDPAGELVKTIEFKNPYYAMMHDFGVTENFAVFHVVPSTGSWDRLEKGLPHFGFDTSMPVYLGVLRRDGDGSDIRWFKSPNLFASHVMNAFDDGERVYFDIPVAKNNMFPFFPDIDGAPFDPVAARSYLTRWTVNMASSSDEFEGSERLTDMIGEFPRIDDRYATMRHSHGWMLVTDPDKPFEGPGGRASGLVMNKLGHVNYSTGAQTSWWAGPQSIIQEPCFIPRTPDAPEGDGYIVALVDNLVTNYSDLAIFDAKAIAEGPIGRAKLPIRIRSGLHGNWADASKLPSR